MKNDFSSHAIDVGSESRPRNLVQCRICHDEDDDSNMETPCSCCGSLKYAHRICIQKWCIEKGDIICEICHQQFRPGYTAPPPLFYHSGISVNFSDLNNPQILDTFATDHNFVDTEFDDYFASTSRSLLCTRIVATTFLVILVLSNILPIIFSRDGDHTVVFFTLLLLRIMVIILLFFYILVKACAAIRSQQHSQVSNASPSKMLMYWFVVEVCLNAFSTPSIWEDRNFSVATLNEEAEQWQPETQPHLIHIQ
ncbi:Ubiquitin--protein ligase [Bertholletia excelsa]